jgi:hypothetical protein
MVGAVEREPEQLPPEEIVEDFVRAPVSVIRPSGVVMPIRRFEAEIQSGRSSGRLEVSVRPSACTSISENPGIAISVRLSGR